MIPSFSLSLLPMSILMCEVGLRVTVSLEEERDALFNALQMPALATAMRGC